MKRGFGLLRPTFTELLHWRYVAVGAEECKDRIQWADKFDSLADTL